MHHLLQTGEGSALFLHSSPGNQAFREAGEELYFILHELNDQVITCDEIPACLSEGSRVVDIIHASVLTDARPTGYSWVLFQAHHQMNIPFDLIKVFHVCTRACYWARVEIIYKLQLKIVRNECPVEQIGSSPINPRHICQCEKMRTILLEKRSHLLLQQEVLMKSTSGIKSLNELFALIG